ncbi:MAG: ABC transporter permease [Thermomicrobiales bacterium]
MIAIDAFAVMARKVAYALLVILGVATFAFALGHLSGDPVDAMAPPDASAAAREALRRRLGLDDPIVTQYGLFLGRVARGDLGESWGQRRPALDAALDRLPATLALTGAAMGLALAVGVPLGLASGGRSRGPLRPLASVVILVGQAVPAFWFGSVLILAFAVERRWFPASGLDGPRSLVLPAVALGLYPAAMIVRLLSVTLADVRDQDWVRTARGKGLRERVIVARHMAPAIAAPVLAFLGVQLGFLVGGAVVVEAVFAYPGLGRLALGAVQDRDIPLIQAVVVVVGTLTVLSSTAADLLGGSIDPRAGDRRSASAGASTW